MSTISYASLERLEGNYAVCEVEQISILDSRVGDFSKACYMADIPVNMFGDRGIPIREGNVYSVEHDGTKVSKVIRIEEAETVRRREWLQTVIRKNNNR